MKKILIALFAFLLTCNSAFAFTFPEPDWGALLNEKKAMVNETDFELYVEGSVESAPYYGARLEPRGGTYMGMIAENSEFMGNTSAYLTYFSMDIQQTDIYYPANNIISASDNMVTIGYTVNSLYNVDYDVIRKSLDTLASYNKQMFIRFANEMNVSSLGDDPDLYISVFRRVADMIHEYPNFAVVWSPNDLGALDRPFEYFYPGDEYVDWIGVSSYMKKYFQGNQNTEEKNAIYFMTGDYAWTTNALKPIIKFMQDNNINKPLMISEGGVATENIYGENLDAWASPRFRNMYYNTIMKYPQVKLINYFNTYRENEKEKFYIHDYQNSNAVSKPYAEYIINEAGASGAYIKNGQWNAEFVFEKADKGSTLQAKDGVVNLYTLAYVPKQPYLTVTYRIDGEWYHSTEASPYKCALALDTLSDGAHTVEISSGNLSKKYTFYKNDDSICFGSEPDNITYDPMDTPKEPEPEISVPTIPDVPVIPETPESDPAQDIDLSAEIKIFLNGAKVTTDTPPVIVNDRTLVPLRVIFEALECNVTWDDMTKTVAAEGRNNIIILRIGENKMFKNNDEIIIDVPAQIINDRTMVPVRAVSEALDCSVEWDGENRTVIING